MTTKEERAERQNRQARVSGAVWGLLCILMGALFLLDSLGKVDMGQTRRFAAGNAVDGNPATRWASSFKEPQWITIDLGAPAEITRVRLSWEAAYAREYAIEVSSDQSSWTTAKNVTDGDGGIDDLDVSASGRYVRMRAIKRALPYGFSLFELEVYGRPGLALATPTDTGAAPAEVLLSQGRPATASSLEGTGYWLLYWPVLMMGSGLPLLLAPKDGGEQVIGLILASLGAVFQLQNLGLVGWRLSQVWPILLVVAGLLLVSQALRQRNPSPSA
jgi:F5/8 type C domain-containing protein/cell wall-active antibiotic response 4TMS protein YvqF